MTHRISSPDSIGGKGLLNNERPGAGTEMER